MSRIPFVRWMALVASGALVACGGTSAPTVDPVTDTDPIVWDTAGGDSAGGDSAVVTDSTPTDGTTPPPADTGACVDYPVVAAIMTGHCTSCHSGAIAPNLSTQAGLQATSALGGTYAQRSSTRMKAGTMPSGGYAGIAADAAKIDEWIAGGYKTSCSTTDSGVTDTGTPPTDTGTPTPICTSGSTGSGGASGSMDPGRNCQDCHKSGGSASGVRFTVAGTLYPTLYEKDMCNGSNAGGAARVVVTNAAGATLTTITPRSNGNFYWNGTVTYPIYVKVTNGTKTNPMATAISSAAMGACNSCHTATGTGAPGRITIP